MRSSMVWEYDFSYSTSCYVVNCRFLSRVTARYSPRLRMSGLFRIVSSQNRYHSGWFNAKIYNSSSFLFPGLLYPPGAPPCSFTNAPTPCRGHGLAACYAGARRVQRRVWGLRRATCRRTFMTRLMLRHKKKVAKRRLKIKQNFYIWLYC